MTPMMLLVFISCLISCQCFRPLRAVHSTRVHILRLDDSKGNKNNESHNGRNIFSNFRSLLPSTKIKPSVPSSQNSIQPPSPPSDDKFNFKKFITESVSLISIPNLFTGIFIGLFVSFQGFFFLSYYINTHDGGLTPVFDSIPLQSVSKNEEINMKKIPEIVTIFEDILLDLNEFYIEQVDNNMLFETAMAAMLKTLDPYTVYENIGEAKSFQESVSGKYGGVGLIISSTVDKKLADSSLSLSSSPPPPSLLSPKETQDTKQIPNTEIREEDKREREREKEKERVKKSPPTGVTVVDAFEGYAYDAGLRIGDRIISVGGVDARRMTVDQAY